MVTILKIAGLILEQFGNLLADEFFWIIVLILIMLYKKNSGIEVRMLGSSYSLFNKVSSSVLVGLAGGLSGSLLVILMGISIEDYTRVGGGSLTEAITYIWIIAVLLALINPRYLCFSYAGGLIALMNLIFRFPSVNVAGLLALIGVLHLIESFLIWIDGCSYSVPLFLKRKDGKTVGGYIMNKVWPIPLIVFAVMFGNEGNGASFAGIIHMPDWWPVLKHYAAEGSSGLVYIPLVVPVVLGYGDMAISKTPEKRCSSSAVRLGCYSLVLIILSVIASKLRFFAYLAAAFAPIAHEMLILYGAKEEEEGKPCFESDENGLKVLYVKKDSPAGIMHIEPGDAILKINGTDINDEKQLSGFLGSYPVFVWLLIKKKSGKMLTVEYTDYRSGIGSLGALIVPRNPEFFYEVNRGGSIAKKLIDRLKKKQNKGVDV
ncbi:MAG TPA: PDZ domain-containing protein [Clostridia bacterium]|nr:PDZ domain-containing protein [Clostridia bacterium]